MRSTSDDYNCEVRSHCHLESLELHGRNGRPDGWDCHDPETSPQEHSAEHPTRFAPGTRGQEKR